MAQRPYLLDTNILVHLIRQNEIGRQINQSYNLISSLGNALISVVTVGELFRFGLKWEKEKAERLAELLDQIVWIDINNIDILKKFGEMRHHLKSKTVGDNDLWIAATACVYDLILLTCDRDFDPLADNFIRRTWIDPANKKT
jgi:tRNA(fMet)-specific endonuclease VapC